MCLFFFFFSFFVFSFIFPLFSCVSSHFFCFFRFFTFGKVKGNARDPVGRDTSGVSNQPKFSSVCKVNVETLKVAIKTFPAVQCRKDTDNSQRHGREKCSTSATYREIVWKTDNGAVQCTWCTTPQTWRDSRASGTGN